MGFNTKGRSFGGELITLVVVKTALLLVLWAAFFASSPAPTAVDVGAALVGPSAGAGVHETGGAHERR